MALSQLVRLIDEAPAGGGREIFVIVEILLPYYFNTELSVTHSMLSSPRWALLHRESKFTHENIISGSSTWTSK